MTSQPERYTKVAIWLHWLIALLIIGQLVGGLYAEKVLEDGDKLKFQLFQWHKSFGITILFLSLFRLAWRVTHTPPALPTGMKRWERLAARGTHILFYVLMIGVPMGGWLVVSTTNYPTLLFGLIPWPHIPVVNDLENSKQLHELFEELHEIGAFAILGLLALHIGAALRHQYQRKDGVLARMIPGVGNHDSRHGSGPA